MADRRATGCSQVKDFASRFYRHVIYTVSYRCPKLRAKRIPSSVFDLFVSFLQIFTPQLDYLKCSKISDIMFLDSNSFINSFAVPILGNGIKSLACRESRYLLRLLQVFLCRLKLQGPNSLLRECRRLCFYPKTRLQYTKFKKTL